MLATRPARVLAALDQLDSLASDQDRREIGAVRERPRPDRQPGPGRRHVHHLTPAGDDHDWYASVSLLPDGTTEIDRGDSARGEQHTATTTDSPDSIASDLTTWIARS